MFLRTCYASNKLGEYRCILSSWSPQINSIGLACCTVVAMINADRSTTSMGFTLSWIMVSNSVLLKQWVAQTTTCNEQLSSTLAPDFVKASIRSNALFLWCCCCSTLKARLTVGGDNNPAYAWWCKNKNKARKTTNDVGCEINGQVSTVQKKQLLTLVVLVQTSFIDKIVGRKAASSAYLVLLALNMFGTFVQSKDAVLMLISSLFWWSFSNCSLLSISLRGSALSSPFSSHPIVRFFRITNKSQYSCFGDIFLFCVLWNRTIG